MKIAFTGSRHWTNEIQIAARLLELVHEFGRENLTICHGDAKDGVDALVDKIARRMDIDCKPFPVRRDLDGAHRGAPLNRNRRMLETFQPDRLIAFRSLGKSNGTDNTITNAEKLGIEVETVTEDHHDSLYS